MCRLPYLVGLRRYREARSDSGFLGKNRERKEKKREKGKTLIRLFISLSYEQKRKHCYVRTRVKYSFLLSQFCFFCYLILILFSVFFVFLVFPVSSRLLRHPLLLHIIHFVPSCSPFFNSQVCVYAQIMGTSRDSDFIFDPCTFL